MARRSKPAREKRANSAKNEANSAQNAQDAKSVEKSPREKMTAAAAALMSERGLAGTSFSDVIERSGAPRGSIYHHFPDGKDALAADAMMLVGDRVLAFIRAREGDTPKIVVHRFVEAWRFVLVKSDFKAGCAIAAVANERLAHPELGARAAAVFTAWEGELQKTLLAAGLSRSKSRVTAALMLAALEGVLVVCRARREIAPLDAVADALVAFVG